jgi:anti-sigma B factor antagonist
MIKHPRRRRLKVEEVGDVTVVNFVDKKLLDEQNIQIIKEQLIGLVTEGGRTRLVLSFSNLEYVGSPFLGPLVLLHRHLKLAHGKLVLCDIKPDFYELLEITKLHLFFTVTQTEQQALACFRERWLQTSCPVYKCSALVRSSANLDFQSPHSASVWLPTCPSCGARLALELSQDSGDKGTPAALRRLTLPTYDGEQVELELRDGVFWLRVAGRLDLFAAEVLERAWRTVPTPRRLVVDLRPTTELTGPGRAALRALLSEQNEGSRGSVLLDLAKSEQVAAFRGDPAAHTSPAAAEASIDNVPVEEQRSITVMVRPDDGTS